MSGETLTLYGERSVADDRRGEAHRRQGWVGGVYPSAHFMARTAAFDGQRIFTRAARSAEIWFAVRSLSEAIDREKSPAPVLAPHPPLTRSPFPS